MLAPTEDTRQTALDFAGQVRLGLYEAVLAAWNGPVKVISSMGKQSTGKSYTLNHLSGSIFNIAGGRCTDGCWMTMRQGSDCLYVILDFEGLGSFERTDQEDMLLSVMNAAISNLTLFKTEFRLDRDIESMFSKFQSGVDLIKGNDKLFSGEFYIIIKDVAERDIDDLTDEFSSKIQAISMDNKGDNFISKMYKQGFSILPFPPLGRAEYYDQLKVVRNQLVESPPSFMSGTEFRDTLTHLMAKISLKDWTSLDRQAIEIRLRYLSENIKNAVWHGKLNAGANGISEDIDGLRCLEEGSPIDDESLQLTMGENGMMKIPLPDSGIVLISSLESRELLRRYFEENLLKRDGNNFPLWQTAYSEFLHLIVERRASRVRRWIQGNVAKWKDDDEILKVKDTVDIPISDLQRNWALCTLKCENCYLGCLEVQHHSIEIVHNCFGTHQCTNFCSYCLKEGQEIICADQMGHNDLHNCKQKSHTCEKECLMSKYMNCNKICTLITGHENEHKCNAKIHMCGQRCSVPDCIGACQINAEKTHTVHKCAEVRCAKRCFFASCPFHCSSRDHFHGHLELSELYAKENQIERDCSDDLASHFCANDHACAHLCQIDGICEVKIELVREKVEEVFAGKRGEFKYQAVREANGERKGCCHRIPPREKLHSGPHTHTTDERTVHYCETKCPSCGYYCELEWGHSEPLHKTCHGNMRNCYFVSDSENIDVGERKYVRGESGTAEMCMMWCKTLSRGHIHILPCDAGTSSCTHAKSDGRRHETRKYGPDELITKDELTHETYWNHIGFQDPCSAEEKVVFKRCPYECTGDHGKEEKYAASYCQLDLWHDPLDSSKPSPTGLGMVSKDGHLFDCKHMGSSGQYHIVFCLDDSGSMCGQPWSELQIAVNGFIQTRLKSSSKDIVSIIIHNTTARIACEAIPISQNPQSYLSYAGGGNSFSKAFQKCHEIISRNNFSQHTPLLLFLSDGGCGDGEHEVTGLKTSFLSKGLIFYSIAFGGADKIKLAKLASLADGTFCNSPDGITLTKTFVEISSKLAQIVSLTSKNM